MLAPLLELLRLREHQGARQLPGPVNLHQLADRCLYRLEPAVPGEHHLGRLHGLRGQAAQHQPLDELVGRSARDGDRVLIAPSSRPIAAEVES